MSADCRVVRPHERDAATAQTPGMARLAGVSRFYLRFGRRLDGRGDDGAALPFRRPPPRRRRERDLRDARTHAHALGRRARTRLDADPGDFVFVPAHTVHQEMSISDEPLVLILARGGQENVVVNVDLPAEVVEG